MPRIDLDADYDLYIPTTDPEYSYTYWDETRQLWVHEIGHPDGRTEQFISLTFPGELFENND